jgi:hypothetical protein
VSAARHDGTQYDAFHALMAAGHRAYGSDMGVEMWFRVVQLR